MSDRDELVIDEVETAFRRAYRRYRKAPAPEKLEIKPELKKAADAWVDAQLHLDEQGDLATPEDLERIREIRRDIDDAAETQALIVGLGRLVGFVAKFV